MNTPTSHRSISTSAETDRPKAKAYGSKAALCLEASWLPEDGRPTVNIEVAPRSGEGVLWQRKLVFQASVSELVQLAGVLIGHLPGLHIKRPGKGVEIQRQPGNLFVRATAGQGTIFALPVTIGDTYFLATVVLSQLAAHSPGLPGDLILANLKSACALATQ